MVWHDNCISIEHKTLNVMNEIITNEKLEKLLERFLKKHPMGDTRDLAKFFYEEGFHAGNTDAYIVMSKKIR